MGPLGSWIKFEIFLPDGVPIISGQHLHITRVNDVFGHKFITEPRAQWLLNANLQHGKIAFTEE